MSCNCAYDNEENESKYDRWVLKMFNGNMRAATVFTGIIGLITITAFVLSIIALFNLHKVDEKYHTGYIVILFLFGIFPLFPIIGQLVAIIIACMIISK